MRLRRPYSIRVFVALFGMVLLAGAVAVANLVVTDLHDWPTQMGGWFAWLYSGAAVLFGLAVGGWLVRQAVLPFRVDIDSQGWSVRTPKLNRYLRWDEIAAVVLANAPAAERRRPTAAPRLLLMPAAGVSLGVPLTQASPVDGRAALELFRLGEVDYGEARFARDLVALAGDRFHNLCGHLTRPPGTIPLRRFPSKDDHARLTRWLDLRSALLVAGWYLAVFVPLLLLTGLAAQHSELLGTAVLVVAVVTIGTVAIKIWFTFSGCRDLADRAAMIDGRDLVTRVGSESHRTNLHSGKVKVLRPGSLRGYGKAWLLAHQEHKRRPEPDLLLSDPRTGRPRSRDDLGALASVLRASPDERDRAEGRQLEKLAAQAPAAECWPTTSTSDDLPASDDLPGLWDALNGVGRAVALLGVVATVALAGGWSGENSAFVGPALIIVAACLFGVWVLYALSRTMGLVDALLRVAARAFR